MRVTKKVARLNLAPSYVGDRLACRSALGSDELETDRWSESRLDSEVVGGESFLRGCVQRPQKPDEGGQGR